MSNVAASCCGVVQRCADGHDLFDLFILRVFGLAVLSPKDWEMIAVQQETNHFTSIKNRVFDKKALLICIAMATFMTLCSIRKFGLLPQMPYMVNIPFVLTRTWWFYIHLSTVPAAYLRPRKASTWPTTPFLVRQKS